MNKLFLTLAVTAGTLLSALSLDAQAGTKVYVPDFPIVGYQVEVAITPFNLVTGAYQGRFEAQGIAGFATFEQQVALGQITAKDLVRAAYMDYRATYEDLSGQTEMIKEVSRFLEAYRLGRN